MEKELAKLLFQKKELFNEGKRGIVYTSKHKDKLYLIKKRKPKSTSPGTIKNEYEYNKKLNKINVGPKIYYYDEEDDFLIRDFVDGIKIEEWVKNHGEDIDFKYKLLGILKEILLQCRSMDLLKINKQELTNPHKDILITKKGPIIIDFERCRFTANPKNVTQFLQYLTRPFMSQVLTSKGIIISKQKVISLGEKYKSDNSANNFLEILDYLKQ